MHDLVCCSCQLMLPQGCGFVVPTWFLLLHQIQVSYCYKNNNNYYILYINFMLLYIIDINCFWLAINCMSINDDFFFFFIGRNWLEAVFGWHHHVIISRRYQLCNRSWGCETWRQGTTLTSYNCQDQVLCVSHRILHNLCCLID